LVDTTKFDQLRIGLASPDEIRRWSRGEVRKPETINYRTFKPEPDGLFCERIFGPTRDWECHCGKYRKIKFRGITCDRCGVEVTRAKVRRERMGHIELATPVSHIWYLKAVPSPMSLLLDISPRPLEKVVYFASYIVTYVDSERLLSKVDRIKQAAEEEKASVDDDKAKAVAAIVKEHEKQIAAERELTNQQKAALEKARDERVKAEDRLGEERKQEIDNALKLLLGSKLDASPGLSNKQLITESEYRALQRLVDILNARTRSAKGGSAAPFEGVFRAALGTEAVKELLREIDLEELSRSLRQEIREMTGPKRARAIKRLEVVEAFRKSKNRPEWMILDTIPVIAPELRPMVQLDGGRFATSDLNDLYRRIINRNNRLKKIRDLHAPESIVNHEKRLLQEAVDALVDNGRRSRPVTGSNNRALKSLSDMLKGKEGRFRKNLLGKRVDYSGRSVIVVGPHLKLHQCGLPKEMALELFKPFVMKRLVERGYTTNVKTAKKMVDRTRPEVWDALEEVIKGHPILLNRAPTLHRLGIQAFEPVLVDGKAIQIHPLVCKAFNADFDGDQMAVHVPLSASAQAEARILMLSTQNLFSPANGSALAAPIRDMVLGCYYLTQKQPTAKGSGKIFGSGEEAVLAYDRGLIDLHAEIRVRIDGAMTDTTVGRVIFNQILPPQLRYVDRVVDDKEIGRIVSQCHEIYGSPTTVGLLDDLKDLGFEYATRGGITISTTDMDIPQVRRAEIIEHTEAEVTRLNQQYNRGLITSGERQQRVCEAWERAAKQVSDAILDAIDPFNPIFMMANSGARGTRRQISQLAGMRGLMTDPFGRFIEDLPIKSNFHEGLSVLEYFVSTHGARKGLADTALRTADAGYLTRRLVDVAQDVIIRAPDCGTAGGIWVGDIRVGPEEIESVEQRIEGRVAAADILDPRTDELILRAGQEIGHHTDPVCQNCSGELRPVQVCTVCGHERTPDAEGPILLKGEEAEALIAESSRDESRLVGAGLGARLEMISPAAAPPEPEEILRRVAAEERAAPPADTVEDPSTVPGAAEDSLPSESEAGQPEAAELEEAEWGGGVGDGLVCPECGGELEDLRVCSGCDRRFQPHKLSSPLTTIRRAIHECQYFLDQADSARAGQPAAGTIFHPFTGQILVAAGKTVSETRLRAISKLADRLREKGGLATGQVFIRSPLTCELPQGICAACYGRDLAAGRRVEVGEAVGIIAAQSIGEPGTQLTMRTFHTGGVAQQYLTGVAEVKRKRQETLKELHEDIRRGLVDIEVEGGGVSSERERVRKIQQMLKVLEEEVKGLLRVVELFEARRPKGQAIVSEVEGEVAGISTRGVKTVIVHSPQSMDQEEHLVGEIAAETVTEPRTDEVLVAEGRELTPQVVAKLRKAKIGAVTIRKSYMVPYRGYLQVEAGQQLQAGDSLTEGPLDPQKVLQMKGVRGIQEYLLREIQSVYKSQGVDINDKHLEIIVRQMLKKRKVVDPGDTELLPGQIVDRFQFERMNRNIRELDGRETTAEWVLLGITEASLATDSFLSAASFQKTTRVLTDAAIKGKTDNLIGLKENVIIGRLIPAGTGMPEYRATRVLSPEGEEPLFMPTLPEVPEPDLAEKMRQLGPPDLLEGLTGPISSTAAAAAATERGAEGEDTAGDDAEI